LGQIAGVFPSIFATDSTARSTFRFVAALVSNVVNSRKARAARFVAGRVGKSFAVMSSPVSSCK
jgi:hypothetical protein